MPEGHTIRAIGNQWQHYTGQAITVTSPSGRTRGTEAISGHEFTAVDVKGKHLFIGFDNDLWIHIHLGRFGRFHWHHDGDVQPPAANVRLRFMLGETWIDLVGPITCEIIDGDVKATRKADLGPDPLYADESGVGAYERMQATARPIGQVLMDQHVIAGVGNIYRAELLWRSMINPYRPANLLTREEFDTLWDDARALLRQGTREHAYGEPTHTLGIPLPDGTNPVPVGAGTRGNHTQAYGRTGLPCARCGTPIVQADMGGRNLFFCPVCQAA